MQKNEQCILKNTKDMMFLTPTKSCNFVGIWAKNRG